MPIAQRGIQQDCKNDAASAGLSSVERLKPVIVRDAFPLSQRCVTTKNMQYIQRISSGKRAEGGLRVSISRLIFRHGGDQSADVTT